MSETGGVWRGDGAHGSNKGRLTSRDYRTEHVTSSLLASCSPPTYNFHPVAEKLVPLVAPTLCRMQTEAGELLGYHFAPAGKRLGSELASSETLTAADETD